MITYNKQKNLLELLSYQYSLQDVEEPNLYRDNFSYDEVPKVTFNYRLVPMNCPDEIWITDTTFRDGQQSRAPYTVEQITKLYEMLHRLGGPKGKIRQCEFFLYSETDRKAIRACQEMGFEFPEITGWIRATKEDFQLVKDMGLKECGILVSCSDYHIFHKLHKTRKQAMDGYLEIVKAALDMGIRPRCHFEDVTRADFYGFVVPFAQELRHLMEQYQIPVKIRFCDTMGYGVPYPGATLPRSVPGIIYGINHFGQFPSELIEWHGHNDFYKAVVNATTAWLYGASSVNCSLLGIGERTGNTPLEAMVMEYAQMRGTLDGMDPTVITEIAEYYEKELDYKIPAHTPFVGADFNVTRAGIHADGIAKDEEIYNIFNTAKILNRPLGVEVNKNSGLAGIAYWLNHELKLEGDEKISKNAPEAAILKEWVDKQYDNGRVSYISKEELIEAMKELTPHLAAKLPE
ncbi:2-isopropylmalate synthase [Anaerotignum lactatifermentans]|uniref:2-isopropylmalate synthase n=1 Tax=Anaerotignum lactatifermentans TaxID=160404 RepID=A0ABS2G5U7_9FIRM|nr:2-isopropylmalate synthase [Anaerotignum lactatifermentans]MBM6828016.1 2-isopropylmalate synthase [Anaerotignum lactatifermentans]MBM6876821.1 2-isopropylmalate synthase [Anaerotignum lactatifermentans]MBM6949599.1 2-isopropylmalate synthase [Anaerotignum lactatifermentans]